MTIIFIGIISAFLTLFINYCIGKPGSKEFSVHEIFSGYSIWLAKMRLKKVGLYNQYSQQYHENLERVETKVGLISLKNDFNKVIFDAAEPYFIWERAAGMCPVCFGFWVSLICGIWFTKEVVSLGIIIVISHITIRLLNKII